MSDQILQNIYRLFEAAWRRRYLICLPILVVPFIALAWGYLTPAIWQTHTTILVQESAKINPFLEDLSVSTNLEERIASLDTLLRSRHVLMNVGYDLNMISTNSTEWQKEKFINEMAASLKVSLIGKDLVQLKMRTDDRQRMDEKLEAVRTRFLNNLLAPELASIEASQDFLQEQLNERKDSLRDAEKKLAEFKKVHAAELPDLYTSNATRLTQLKELLTEKTMELAGAEAAKKSIRARLANVDPVISTLEREIVATKTMLAGLRSKYTEKHSKVQLGMRKLTRLQKEREIQVQESKGLSDQDLTRLWELANQVDISKEENQQNSLLVSQLQELQKVDNKVQQLSIEVDAINQQLVDVSDRVSNFGEMERSLTELERDLEAKRSLYNNLLERFEKASVTGALGRFEQPERIKIIDEPYLPINPVNLPLLVYLIAGIFGGIFLGVSLAMIAEIFDTSVRNTNDFERILGVKVLTRIPAHPMEEVAL